MDPDSPFVSEVLSWVKVNPGAQGKIGSFHPITEGDWTEGGYISPEAVNLFQVVNSGNPHQVQQAINGGVEVDSRDPAGSKEIYFSCIKFLGTSLHFLLHVH